MTPAAFHGACDGVGPTVTLIRSDGGYTFGGYTGVPWASSGRYKPASSSFLFSVVNPYGDPVMRFPLKSPGDGKAVYHAARYGPTFGGGIDMTVRATNSPTTSFHFCYCNFPATYEDESGRNRGNATFTGAREFTLADIEIWSVV